MQGEDVRGVEPAVADVRGRIAAAAERAGRDPATVTLVAVSKLQPEAAVRAAVAAGLRDFGENYVQHLSARAAALADVAVPLRWHAIGPIQRNKVNAVVAVASCVHAVDREALARALAARRDPDDPLEVYVQVNVAGEATKAGVATHEVGPLVDAVRALPSLRLLGLMGMPPAASVPEDSRPHFAALRALAARHGLTGLSMGTSDDYEVAVEEGATAVRVGRSLFGARP